ncbi:four helix bundle protein [Candidatus Uhrbacteria bacterium]|nr:four helix bundle protein [Candidatus Uhrbacteria bacterium]
MQGEINLHKIEVYNIARELSRESWNTFKTFEWHTRKIIGDQWITAIDSVGANIAEAHGRFHYLDKIKFLYNARGSLYETLHWLGLMKERGIIAEAFFQKCNGMIQGLAPKLNRYIEAHYQRKQINTNRKSSPLSG